MLANEWGQFNGRFRMDQRRRVQRRRCACGLRRFFECRTECGKNARGGTRGRGAYRAFSISSAIRYALIARFDS